MEEGMKSVNPEEGEKGEKNRRKEGEEEMERREELRTPGPVDIVGVGEEFEEAEISSSSEIEVLLTKLLIYEQLILAY